MWTGTIQTRIIYVWLLNGMVTITFDAAVMVHMTGCPPIKKWWMVLKNGFREALLRGSFLWTALNLRSIYTKSCKICDVSTRVTFDMKV